jgi:hypothetical protein
MTRAETVQILATLRAAFPHSFKDMGQDDIQATVNLWAMMFADDPYPAVNASVCALIASRKTGYSPTIGEVKEKLQDYAVSDAPSETEAWALVSKACRNGLYGYRKEFDKLPPAVQEAVGAAEQLRAWAAMDVETVESVVASNFKRAYRTVEARRKERAMLPQSVRQAIGQLTETMKIGGDNDERTLLPMP